MASSWEHIRRDRERMQTVTKSPKVKVHIDNVVVRSEFFAPERRRARRPNRIAEPPPVRSNGHRTSCTCESCWRILELELEALERRTVTKGRIVGVPRRPRRRSVILWSLAAAAAVVLLWLARGGA